MPDDFLKRLESLNEQQREAVEAPPGPLLILAGAGSGKTRVLTHRIAYFIHCRNVSPWHILAVTFTNKAATEMGERVRTLLPNRHLDIQVSTFHKACVRILRRHIDRLGFKSDFGILDDTDQVALLKRVLEDLGLEARVHDARQFRGLIDRAKNALQGPDDVDTTLLTGTASALPDVYRRYQERLKQMNAVDFGDILWHAVALLESHPDLRDYYHGRFRHILVDEYQDTNHAQYRLTRLLVSPEAPSVCVVGDEDQSIYGFRGADISNIVEFPKDFPGTRVIKLEKNYRSTGRILHAASSVVERNEYRLGKKLISVRGEGEYIRYIETETDYDEAARVAEEVQRLHGLGIHYGDMAVFYRANFQSRLLEETFSFRRIPFLLVGQGFFDRKEIKDLRAYLQLIYNPADDVALDRILNVPTRGIGAKARAFLFDLARKRGVSCYRVLEEVAGAPSTFKPHGAKLKRFFEMMEPLRRRAESASVPELIEAVLDETGYREKLAKAGDLESEGRLENLREFINIATEVSDQAGREGLRELLERITLHAQADEVEAEDGRVTLMTIHNAKGLEFPVVFIVGMEEGLFPHERTLESQTDLEEERRLCYVGMTRAMDRLFLLRPKTRMLKGERRLTIPSRFLREVPPELIKGRRGMAVARFGCTLDAERGVTTATARPWNVGTVPGVPGSSRLQPDTRQRPGWSEDPDDPYKDLRVGQRVLHPIFGEGIIRQRQGSSGNLRLVIHFDGVGEKKIVARYATGLELLYG